MISENILNMIEDTRVRATHTITVQLDPDRTPETFGMHPSITFAPDQLEIGWVRENGGRWLIVHVRIEGNAMTGKDGRALWKSYSPTVRDLPLWVREIVNETKPKE